MNSLTKTLFLLEYHVNNFISGEFLAKFSGVSRNAIWKNINKLKSMGYNIESVNNKGYMLSGDDILSEAGIISHLYKQYKKTKQTEKAFNLYEIIQSNQIEKLKDLDIDDELSCNWTIEVLESTKSTNTYLKEQSTSKSINRHVVIAKEQVSGRGRYGRNFFSPNGSGIYMSIGISEPKMLQKLEYLTAIAGICVCDVIETFSDKKPKIKWVNDVFIENKKVAGILSEANYSIENKMPEYAIVGIGINVFKPFGDFPEDIQNIAGYLYEDKSRILNQMIAQILYNIEYYLLDFPISEIVSKYKSLSNVIGRDIKVLSADNSYDARVIDIDENCKLIVKDLNGNIQILNSGEISIKL